MAPPSFADLGKDARDLFSKGFHNGIVQVDLKTVAANKVEFKVKGSRGNDSAKLDGKVEAKYKSKAYGTTLTESIDTKNTIGCKVEVEEKVIDGLKLVLDSTFNTGSGAKDGSFKGIYEHKYFQGELESALQLKAPVLKAAGLIGCPADGYEGWLAGGCLHFDSSKNSLVKNELALAYHGDDLKLVSHIKDLNEFGCSVYNRVNSATEVGLNVSWTAGTTFTKFGLACKHKLDRASHLNMAVDNTSSLRLGYTNEVQPGVKFTFSGALDTKAISGGDHKIGFGVDFDLSN